MKSTVSAKKRRHTDATFRRAKRKKERDFFAS
jgi:hypothetical protein